MRIFVSSSFEDLKEHRAAAIRVLRQLGHEVIGEHRDVAHPLPDVLVVGRDFHEALVIGRRVDVIEEIDFSHTALYG